MTTHEAGVLDTSIIAALRLYDPAALPSALLITAVTLESCPTGRTPPTIRSNGRPARPCSSTSKPRLTRFPTIMRQQGSTGRYARPSAPRDASHGPEPPI